MPDRPSTTVVQEILDLEGNERLAMAIEHADELRAWNTEWSGLADKAGERKQEWETLSRLLVHASGFESAEDVAERARAVEENRLLLKDPDEVAPLANELTTQLRAEVKNLHQQLTDAIGTAVSALENDESWGRLEQAKQQELLPKHDLIAPAEPELGGTGAVVVALDSASLAARRNEFAAVRRAPTTHGSRQRSC